MLSGKGKNCGDNELTMTSAEDVIDIDALWIQGCIGCEKKGGDLLVCSVRDCPSAFHHKCFSDLKPEFTVDGGLICSYCCYKQKVINVKEMIKEVILTSKASTDFMNLLNLRKHNEKKNDTDVAGISIEAVKGPQRMRDSTVLAGDDQNRNMAEQQPDKLAPGLPPVGGGSDAAYCGYLEENTGVSTLQNHEFENVSNLERREENSSEHSDDATGRKIPMSIPVTSIFAQEQCIYPKEKPNEVNKIQNHQVGNVIEQQRGETNRLGDDSFQCMNKETTAAVPHSKSIEATIVAAETECLHPKAAQVEASPCASDKLKASILDTEVHTKHTSPGCQAVDSSKRAQAHPNAVLVEAPCESEMSEASDSNTEAHLLHVKCTTKQTNTGRQDVDLSHNSSYQSPRTSEGYVQAQNNETLSSEMPGKNPESSKPIDLVNFIKEKRKRHFWTTEEEDMLREGVLKFVTTATKNIPWKKILVFGGEVFKDRAPSDLKDKWKLLMKIKRKQ